MKKNLLKKIAFTAIMIALGTVLSMVKIWKMPFGGSITLLSMLPVVAVSVTYGIGWGRGAGFLSSLVQLGLDLPEMMGWGLTPQIFVGAVILDYLVAFTVIGLAGIFRKKGNVGICLGTALAVALRFVSHFLSGFILWTNLDKFIAFGKTWINHPVLYSLCYNGAYMLPELVITVIGVILLSKANFFARLQAANPES